MILGLDLPWAAIAVTGLNVAVVIGATAILLRRRRGLRRIHRRLQILKDLTDLSQRPPVIHPQSIPRRLDGHRPGRRRSSLRR
ncbi:hypothetical protein M9M90_21055 (plasmid) [Phenylobacterium sp. LH3H17]|uniref:hypothetical protein n=1 Tax=Phenylobacterium sp. LH3H17 TaxID=2903901 RepID=UPI0020CA1504|nr:hypothetical protein [Phenylobacterium sp. LH3H17]UTP41716.1 hypothetical protein M9M90_21055 [Phenylobacterium sp. LH3H17]